MSEPYRVEYLRGCLVVWGHGLPFESLADFFQIYAMDPSQIRVSSRHARRIGASMVCGTREGLQRFERSGEKAAEWVQEDIDRAFDCGLGPQAMEWLNSYNRTDATDAMFSYLTGCPVLHGVSPEAPVSDDGFASCVRMVETVPSLSDHLYLMAEVSPQWEVLVGAWDPLVALMNAETPDWRAHSFAKLPRTEKVLRNLIRATGAVPPPSTDEVFSGVVNRIEAHGHLAGLVAITIDAKRYYLLNDGASNMVIDVGSKVEFATMEATITTPCNEIETVACAHIVTVDGHVFE